MASLDIAVVFDNWILILVFTIFGLFWNLICIAYFAYFIFDDYWFEKSLIEFGNSTGVVASGLLLLRLADPKNISKTLVIPSGVKISFHAFKKLLLFDLADGWKHH